MNGLDEKSSPEVNTVNQVVKGGSAYTEPRRVLASKANTIGNLKSRESVSTIGLYLFQQLLIAGTDYQIEGQEPSR